VRVGLECFKAIYYVRKHDTLAERRQPCDLQLTAAHIGPSSNFKFRIELRDR